MKRITATAAAKAPAEATAKAKAMTKAAMALAAAMVLLLNSCLLQDEEVRVWGVSLDKTALELTEGDGAALVATVAPADARNRAVTWVSSAPTVASVDDEGRVSALKAGSATITVTTDDGGKTDECAVTVRARRVAVTEIVISPPGDVSLPVGPSATITVAVLPADATVKVVRWSSSELSIATVTAESPTTARVTGVRAGEATITATATDGSGVEANKTITVTTAPVPVTPLVVNTAAVPRIPAMTVGVPVAPADLGGAVSGGTKPYTFAAAGLPAGLSIDAESGTVSGAPTVAAGAGTATVTVSDSSGERQSVEFAVEYGVATLPAIPVTGIVISPSGTVSVEVGSFAELSATVLPDNATVKTVTWSSSTPTVATVDAATGKVTGVSTGTAAITASATDGRGVTATKGVTVRAVGAPTYTISASRLVSFGAIPTPYTPPAAQTVTVTNDGSGSVTLTQPTATAYVIGTLSKTVLERRGETATFTVRPEAGLAVGTYNETIRIDGTDGARATVAAEFSVLPTYVPDRPVINIGTQPANATVTEGSIAGSLSVAASVSTAGNPTLSYQWYSNTAAGNEGGTPVDGATSAAFAIPAALTEGTYYYYCVVNARSATTGDAAPVTSRVATVTVLPSDTPPPLPTMTVGAQAGEVRFGAGGTVTFPVTATGTADGIYNAKVDNLPDGVNAELPAGGIVIAGGRGTLTLAVGAATPAGGYGTLRLALDLDTDADFADTADGGSVLSPPFALTVLPRIIVPGAIDGVPVPTVGEPIPGAATVLTVPDGCVARIVRWLAFPDGGEETDATGNFVAGTVYVVEIELTTASADYAFDPNDIGGWTVNGKTPVGDAIQPTAGSVTLRYLFAETAEEPEVPEG